MTVYECLGYGLMGFGPALSMFALTISQHPSRVVILLVSSFGWLLSLLLSSLAWLALSPLGAHLALGVALAVFFQEAARLMTLRGLRRMDKRLNLAALTGPAQLARSRAGLAYASGLGFGVASGACSLLNVLADAAKMGAPPGLQGITESVPYSFFLVSALTTSVLVVLHTLWSVISFQAMWMRNPVLLAYAPLRSRTSSLRQSPCSIREETTASRWPRSWDFCLSRQPWPSQWPEEGQDLYGLPSASRRRGALLKESKTRLCILVIKPVPLIEAFSRSKPPWLQEKQGACCDYSYRDASSLCLFSHYVL